MSRKPRQKSLIGLYHITMRGNGKQLLFEDDEDRRRILSLVRSSIVRFNIRLIGITVATDMLVMFFRIGFRAPLFRVRNTFSTLFDMFISIRKRPGFVHTARIDGAVT